MRYATGNLWTYPAGYRVVTTNGIIKMNGEAVMGAGVAKQAAELYPKLPKALGDHIREHGNVVGVFHQFKVITFPTKDHWRAPSILSLIDQSCRAMLRFKAWDEVIVMPPPGTGKGGLTWEQVQPILEDYFKGWDNLIVLLPKEVAEVERKKRKESINHLVLNVRNGYRDVDVYCGRPMRQVPEGTRGANGFFGNPIKLGQDTYRNRVQCLCDYYDWLMSDAGAHIRVQIPKLKGLKLGCWCSPKLCHAQILATLANFDDGYERCAKIISDFKEWLSAQD